MLDSMRAHLLAVTPPGNAERMLGGIREELFRRHALASALALPALLPLGFLARPEPGFPAALERATAAARRLGLPLEVGGYREEAGALFLQARTQGLWGALREAAGRLQPLVPGFLPAYEGFFLAQREHLSNPARALADLPAPCIRRFFPSALCLLEIDSAEPEGAEAAGAAGDGAAPGGLAPGGGRPWWRRVSWEERLRLPLRRGPRPPRDR